MNQNQTPRIVYVVGAGLSAGLGFPTIGNLLPKMWPRLVNNGYSTELAKVIRFHHPAFNELLPETFPNIEKLLSEMEANEHLFWSSRAAAGTFTLEKLTEIREGLLLEIADWFHELKTIAIRKHPKWLFQLASKMKEEKAQVVSFNWDLVLDEILFGNDLNKEDYGFGRHALQVRLIKPHGSLNWYRASQGRTLKDPLKFVLRGTASQTVFAFRRFRAPKSSKRTYSPLIVPPVYTKQFRGKLFQRLWNEAVNVVSTASEVRFIGYSLADSDFHARFALRCGFHNQIDGKLNSRGVRGNPTGRASVTIVDPCPDDSVIDRISDAVGWEGSHFRGTVEDWVNEKWKE